MDSSEFAFALLLAVAGKNQGQPAQHAVDFGRVARIAARLLALAREFEAEADDDKACPLDEVEQVLNEAGNAEWSLSVAESSSSSSSNGSSSSNASQAGALEEAHESPADTQVVVAAAELLIIPETPSPTASQPIDVVSAVAEDDVPVPNVDSLESATERYLRGDANGPPRLRAPAPWAVCRDSDPEDLVELPPIKLVHRTTTKDVSAAKLQRPRW